jgi:ParB family chromosome partitioning protein
VKPEPKRRALGKGLSSLIPDAPNQDPLASPDVQLTEPGASAEVPLDRLRANPHQPRSDFDGEEIQFLAASIRSSGVLQPLLVRPEEDGTFTVIAGERRMRAAKDAGLETVPVICRDLPDSRLLELALVENLQRDDLGPIETASAFRALIRDHGLTQAEVASRVGKPRSTVANFLRLLDLPDDVRSWLATGELSMGHGRALASLDDAGAQLELGREAVRKGLSVREVEQRVHDRLEPNRGETAERRSKAPKDPNVAAAETSLGRALGARVAIKQARAGGGRVEIRFKDDDDLDRLFRLLLRSQRTGTP